MLLVQAPSLNQRNDSPLSWQRKENNCGDYNDDGLRMGEVNRRECVTRREGQAPRYALRERKDRGVEFNHGPDPGLCTLFTFFDFFQ